jgi:hypothetical protein
MPEPLTAAALTYTIPPLKSFPRLKSGFHPLPVQEHFTADRFISKKHARKMPVKARPEKRFSLIVT